MEPKAKVTAGVGFIAPVLSLKSEIAGFTETQRETATIVVLTALVATGAVFTPFEPLAY